MTLVSELPATGFVVHINCLKQILSSIYAESSHKFRSRSSVIALRIYNEVAIVKQAHTGRPLKLKDTW